MSRVIPIEFIQNFVNEAFETRRTRMSRSRHIQDLDQMHLKEFMEGATPFMGGIDVQMWTVYPDCPLLCRKGTARQLLG